MEQYKIRKIMKFKYKIINKIKLIMNSSKIILNNYQKLIIFLSIIIIMVQRKRSKYWKKIRNRTINNNSKKYRIFQNKNRIFLFVIIVKEMVYKNNKNKNRNKRKRKKLKKKRKKSLTIRSMCKSSRNYFMGILLLILSKILVIMIIIMK